MKDNVCKRCKENLFQSCEKRMRISFPGNLPPADLLLDINILASIFDPSESTFLKSQRMCKNLAWLYQSSNTRHIGGKKLNTGFTSALRRTSVRSSTKEYVEGQASLERVEVAMGKCWTDMKKSKTEANNCEWQPFGQAMPQGSVWGLSLPP